MKSNRVPITSCPLLRTIGIAALAVAALTGLTVSTSAQNNLQTDNFDNNPTLTGWATSVTTNYPANLTFVTDMYGGKALRLTASSVGSVMWTNASTNTLYGGTLQDTVRAMLWMTNHTYSTNFYIAVDLVDWNTSPDRTTNDPVFGLIAHCTNVVRTLIGGNTPPTDVPGAVGQPDGVILALRYNADGGNTTANGTRGQLLMYGVHAGYVSSILAATCQGDYTLNPGHKYRIMFTGTNMWDPVSLSYTNQSYWGRVYDLQDLTRPLSTISTYETLWPYYSGNGDGDFFSPAGYSGVGAMGYNGNQGSSWSPMTCDVTIDNFVAANDPPPWLSLPATPYGFYGPSGVPVPQVVNRQPASWSNFYAPAGGITFNATTFTNNNITSISLFINGVNVTSSLTVTGPTTNRSVSYFGLTSNTVYDARIELADALGRNTTNVWTFDTFSDAFLASAVCKNIECEDFDFNGSFIDNPVASGYTWLQTSNNVLENVPFPWPSALNQGPTGYVNQPGINARTNNGVGDFFCFNNGNSTGGADYRPLGSIGTELGCAEALCFSPANGGGYGAVVTEDTQRQKYSSVDPNLEEYIVADTQGGEWNNYTRIFYGTNYYNVYLREGCELSQQLSLDVVGAGSTLNHLGTFYTTNAFGKSNFRYAPLVTTVIPANSLIANGTFTANAASFNATVAPGLFGYCGDNGNPSSITSWTDSGGGFGINGTGTSVLSPFSPDNSGGLTYAFLQGTGQALVQSLTTLTPNTTYQLVYSVAGRSGNTVSYRVVVYSDNTYTTSYYDSGVQAANSSGFVTVSATFTTPPTLGAAPNIQLMNASVAGDNTVDYANVFLVPGSSWVPGSSQLAVVNLSGTNTLRLTVAVPQVTQYQQGLSLNYMAFVPAFVVLSSSQAKTGYTFDTTAVINQITQTITIPQNGSARFYRVLWTRAVRVTNTTLASGNITMTYQ